MARVFLGVGSNIEREHYIPSGLSALRSRFDVQKVSSIYESAAVGFQGEPFYNLVVEVNTDMSIAELQHSIRQIENDNGSPRCAARYSSRTLDIDILLYDDVSACIDGVVLPRDEILFNAFVLWPLAEIAPLEVHPVVHKNYKALWAEFDKAQQKIVRVEGALATRWFNVQAGSQ